MPHRSGPPTSPPVTPEDLSKRLYEGVKEAFSDEWSQRYDVPVTLARIAQMPEERSVGYAEFVLELQSKHIDFPSVPLHVVLDYFDGNVYDVCCRIEDQSREWAYACADSNQQYKPLALSRKMVTFYLRELEKTLGRRTIENLGQPSIRTDRSETDLSGTRCASGTELERPEA